MCINVICDVLTLSRFCLGEPGEISFDPGDIITNIDQIDEGIFIKLKFANFLLISMLRN